MSLEFITAPLQGLLSFIPGEALVALPAVGLFLFRQTLFGGLSGMIKGTNATVPIIAAVAGGLLGWMAHSGLSGGQVQRLASSTLKQSQAFMARTAAVENRALQVVALHTEQNLQCVTRLDEATDLLESVIQADEAGRARARARAKAIKDQERKAAEYYEQQLKELRDAKKSDTDVAEFLETRIPDSLRRIDGLRDDTGAVSPSGADRDVSGE